MSALEPHVLTCIHRFTCTLLSALCMEVRSFAPSEWRGDQNGGTVDYGLIHFSVGLGFSVGL